MTPSVVIVGFEKDYSNQIRQLLEHADTISSIRIQDEEKQNHAKGCWGENDIALINAYNPNYPDWLKNCLQNHENNPPASLIIGGQPIPSTNNDERRAAPRLHLSDKELTGNRLLDAIQRLASARHLPPINQEKTQHQVDSYHQEDSSKYQAIPDAVHQSAPLSDHALNQEKVFVGQYQLKQLLGIGGMASVYRAVGPDLQPVAVKLIDPAVLDDDRLLDRFIEEYELLSTIEHTNIIRVYEQGFTDSHVYIVMQLLEKDCLKSRIQKGLTVQKALLHAIDISHALSTIHDLGILHRDLKPNNILFDKNGRAVITDFGIAKGMRNNNSADLTLHGEAIGTPAYMSPEQALGHELTTSCDLYAFGVMFYRMLTGKLPFQAKTPIAMMQKHIDSPPPHLPEDLIDLDHIVQKLLCKQPTRRYQSARDLHDELIQFVC